MKCLMWSKGVLVAAWSCTVLGWLAGPVSTVNAQGSLSGAVYDDVNQNRVQDQGEPGLGGWLVQAIAADGTVHPATTETDGSYDISGLDFGSYVIRQEPQPGWFQTSPNFTTAITLGDVTGDWDYVDGDDVENGPATWPAIAPDAGGSFQSPINIASAPTIDLSKVVSFHYDPADKPEKLKNNGHNAEIEYPEPNGNHMVIGGEEFELLQFHFHHQSEHEIDSQPTPMELHLVHKHHDGGLAVVGVTMNVGQANTELAGFFDGLSQVPGPNPGEIAFEEEIDLDNLLPGSSEGWYYNGSLTTPPATEGVNWFVFEDPIEISAEQLGLYESLLDSLDLNPNNRPVQALNGRRFNEIDHQVTLDSSGLSGLDFGVAVPEPTSLGILAGMVGVRLLPKRRRQ